MKERNLFSQSNCTLQTSFELFTDWVCKPGVCDRPAAGRGSVPPPPG